jgi:hypothetical protein
MTSAEFEPAIPVTERPQTHTLDRKTTCISHGQVISNIYLHEQFLMKVTEVAIRLF